MKAKIYSLLWLLSLACMVHAQTNSGIDPRLMRSVQVYYTNQMQMSNWTSGDYHRGFTSTAPVYLRKQQSPCYGIMQGSSFGFAARKGEGFSSTTPSHLFNNAPTRRGMSFAGEDDDDGWDDDVPDIDDPGLWDDPFWEPDTDIPDIDDPILWDDPFFPHEEPGSPIGDVPWAVLLLMAAAYAGLRYRHSKQRKDTEA